MASIQWDTATPSAYSSTLTAIETLSTNEQMWTTIRTGLFAISTSFRLFFLCELILRLISTNWTQNFLSFFHIIDLIAIVSGVIMKFVLSAQYLLIANFLIILRFGRIWNVFEVIINDITTRIIMEQIQMKQTYDRLLSKETRQTKKLNKKIQLVQAKLQMLMGYFHVILK